MLLSSQIFKWTDFLYRNKKKQRTRQHQKMISKCHEQCIVRHQLNLSQPLNSKLLPIVCLPRNMYCHYLQLQELLLQGFPAMDGSAKSPRQRVNWRMEKCFQMYQGRQVSHKRMYQILQKPCLLRGSGQLDGICALTGAEIKVSRW
jgi:hypothetical protein